jgi:osmotically-inducible protein OsmY
MGNQSNTNKIDDAQIRTQITALLGSITGANKITPDVAEGDVTLGGEVAALSVKNAVIAELRKVDGIRSITNNIQVLSGSPQINVFVNSKIPDHKTRINVLRDKLQERINSVANAANVTVAVAGGIAQLGGYIDTIEAKDEVIAAAAKVPGIVDVKESIAVTTASPYLEKIIEEIKTTPGIKVKVKKATITLKGRIESEAVKEDILAKLRKNYQLKIINDIKVREPSNKFLDFIGKLKKSKLFVSFFVIFIAVLFVPIFLDRGTAYKFDAWPIWILFLWLLILPVLIILILYFAFEVYKTTLQSEAKQGEQPAQPVGMFETILTKDDLDNTEGKGVRENRILNYIEIWKKTIDVQQHFNDLELRIRNFALTVLGVILSAAALSLRDSPSSLLCITLLIIALVSWTAFYLMDQYWYHYLLKGAVLHGMKIENSLKNVLPEIGLTKSIGDASPIRFRSWQIRSTHKMTIFYGLIALVLLFFIAMVAVLTWLEIFSWRGSPPKPQQVQVTMTTPSPSP